MLNDENVAERATSPRHIRSFLDLTVRHRTWKFLHVLLLTSLRSELLLTSLSGRSRCFHPPGKLLDLPPLGCCCWPERVETKDRGPPEGSGGLVWSGGSELRVCDYWKGAWLLLRLPPN